MAKKKAVPAVNVESGGTRTIVLNDKITIVDLNGNVLYVPESHE